MIKIRALIIRIKIILPILRIEKKDKFMSKKQLLFPTDFSENSVEALKETAQLNQLLKYKIIILHTYSRPYSDKNKDVSQESKLLGLEQQIDRKFKKFIDQVSEVEDQDYEFKKIIGYSVDVIREEVEKNNIDLVMMSTKGAVGVGELFGTRTSKIIKNAETPIIVVPPGTHLSELDKLGLACDFSENTSYEKIDFLINLAEVLNLEIDIITLNRQEKTMTEAELSNREKLLSIMSHLPAKSSYTHHDDVNKGLIEYCKNNSIGLLTVLPKSYNYIENIFHESLTRRMAFQSPIPILVLK